MAGLLRGNRVEATSSGSIPLDALLANGVRENPDVDVLATRGNHGISIMIWNYHDDDVAGPNASIVLSVHGLPAEASRVLMTHYRIDRNHSNAYSVWENMSSPQSVTADQQRQLEAAGQLQQVGSPSWMRNRAGTISINFDLPRQSVSLLQLEW